MAAMRVQEIHPAIVHFPIALLPTAVAADALGWLTGSRALLDTGRTLMPAAAASAAVAGVAGFAAQAAVRAEGRAHDQLVTHRNLNVGLLALMVGLAVVRARRPRPTAGTLLVGLAGAALATYTGYLGGKMVYEHGVGVRAAGGVLDEAAPEIRRGTLARAARVAAADVGEGLGQTAQETAEGEIAPELR